ncbi:unnamed protein product [Didymodactylos carnosus]|nr:unnamed protein product [Didymodactylos carnosus]CAF3857885.1 unnamed protein product [Didymodactylos carnosus]
MLDSTTPFQQRNEQPALKNEQNITQLSSSSITISSNIKQSSSSSLTTAMGDKQYNEKYNQVVCSCSSASTNYTTLTTPSSFQKQNNDSSRQQPVMYGSLRSISPKSGVSLHIKASTSNQDSPSNDMSPYQQQAQMQPPSSGSEIVDKGTDSSRPFSQIGIHNHVSLKLHFNNQTPQQPSAIPPPVQVPIQPQTPAPVPYTTNISDSKDVSDRLIQTLVQRFQNNQQKSTSTHPHTIEYFRQDSTKSGSMNNQSVLDQQRPSSLNIIFSSHNNNSTTPVPSTSSTLSNGPTIPQHQKSSFIQSTNILTAKQQEMIHQMPQQHRSTQQQSFDQSNLLEPLHNTYSSNKNTNYTARFSDFKSSPNMMNEGKQQDSQPSLPKEPVNNDMSSNNLLRLTSTHQHQSLPQFTTLADLKEYLQKMGLVIELVPTDQPSPTQLKNVPTSTLPPPPPPSTAKSVIQLERDQAVRSGAISGMSDHGQIVLKTQPQVVMVMNNNSQRLMSNIREENGGRVQEQQQQQSSRSSSIEKSLSVPPSVLTEKLLEYAATTSNNQQYQQNSSKQIVSNIANLLVKTTDKEQSVLSPTQSVIQITQNNHVQQITRSTVPSETYRSSTIQQPQHQQMSSVDHTPIIIPTRTQIVNNPMDSYNNNSNNNNNMKSYNNMDLIRFQQAPQSHSSDNRHLRMNLDDKTQKITPEKVRRELTSTLFNLHHHSHQHHDIPLLQDHDGHLHDREVEEFMIGKESITKDATKLKLFHNKSDDDKMSTTQTMITTGSNDSNSCTPSTITINNNSNDNNNSNNPNGNHNNNSNKLNAQGHASKSSGQSICELLMLLYEQERTRSTQLQKQIDQVSRQRSRNSSGQSSESQTGLETPHGLDNRHGAPLSPAAWGLSGSASNSNSNSNSASTSRGANGKEKSMNILNGLSQMPSHALNRPLKFDPSYNGDSESQDRDLNECSPPDSNKNAISPTKVTQFSAVIPSQSIPRPVPLIQTQDGLVRHTTTTATTNSSVNTGMTTNSTANGQFFSPSNRVFQSPLSQLFQNALSPAACGVLSPFLSPSTSRSDTPSELILPHDLISVLNSRVWSEEDLLNAFIKNFDPSVLVRYVRNNVLSNEINIGLETNFKSIYSHTDLYGNKNIEIERIQVDETLTDKYGLNSEKAVVYSHL